MRRAEWNDVPKVCGREPLEPFRNVVKEGAEGVGVS
jgi:hypothetical protein